LAWDGFSKFFSQLVGWTFPGEETGGIEASFVTEGGSTKLRVESVAEDGSPRDFYSTSAAVVGPDLLPDDVALAQVAPGLYEAPLGEIEPGAYAVRVTQTRPGSQPLGRTVGLVAPTAAEYRLLGPNEPFLASLRSATGGRQIETPVEPWTHDLATTDTFQDLWPLLLVLALLLWPLDIALRRVSVGRRELAGARRRIREGWRRRGAAAPRPVSVEGMFAARDRAAGSSARAAMLRGDVAAEAATTASSATAAPAAAAPAAVAGAAAAAAAPAAQPRGTPAPSPPVAEAVAEPPPKPASPEAAPNPSPAAPADDGDTLARLRAAKRRARN
jgi:hypothetical protein